MRVVFLGLSIASSWGNGHATNYRALVRELSARGHEVLFLEGDASPENLAARHSGEVAAADLVVVGNQLALERLLIETARRAPLLSFAVAGTHYPPEIEWPDNVERIEHVALDDVPAFYASQRFTLNITGPEVRATDWTPSARLFESATGETPVVSDRWEGLGQIFALDEEILIADSAEDVVDYLTEIGEDERAEIGGRARQRTLAEHTAERRCEQLEEEVAGALAG